MKVNFMTQLQAEQQELETIAQKGSHKSQKVVNALILLTSMLFFSRMDTLITKPPILNPLLQSYGYPNP
jgi:hypothetical protein